MVLFKPLLFHWNGQHIKPQSALTSFIKDSCFPVLRNSRPFSVDDECNVNNVNRFPHVRLWEEYPCAGSLLI